MAKNNDDVILEIDEMNLEDLIVLGDDKKIPIEITFPNNDGNKVRAKALIKQLTLKEMEGIQIGRNDVVKANLIVLERALFKSDGSHFNDDELNSLPIGVVNAIAAQIMEVSGVEFSNQRLGDF